MWFKKQPIENWEEKKDDKTWNVNWNESLPMLNIHWPFTPRTSLPSPYRHRKGSPCLSWLQATSPASFPTPASMLFLPQGLCTCCYFCLESSPPPVGLPITSFSSSIKCCFSRGHPWPQELNINLPPSCFSSRLDISFGVDHTCNILFTCSMSVCHTWMGGPWDRVLRHRAPWSSPQYLKQCLTHRATQYVFIDCICCNQFLHVNLASTLNLWLDFLTTKGNLSNYKPPWSGSRVSHDRGTGDRECNLPHLLQINLKHSSWKGQHMLPHGTETCFSRGLVYKSQIILLGWIPRS